jgi:DNA-binding transcriptional ArsR family regulator
MDRFPDRQVDLSEVEAELFKGLAHPVRVRVLELLAAAEGTVPVSDLLASTGMEASHLSQHLSVLRGHHLVRSTRRGSQVFYELASPQVPDLLAAARELLLNVLQTNQEQLAWSLTQTAPALPSRLDSGDV